MRTVGFTGETKWYSGIDWTMEISSLKRKKTKPQSLWKEEKKTTSDFKRMEEAELSVVAFDSYRS